MLAEIPPFVITLLEAALQSDRRHTRGTPKQLLNSQETRFITTRLRPSLFSVCGGRILWTQEPYHPEQDCQQTLSLSFMRVKQQDRRTGFVPEDPAAPEQPVLNTQLPVVFSWQPQPCLRPELRLFCTCPPARLQDCVGTVQQPERHCVCSLALTNTTCVISSVSLLNSILT